MLPRLVAVGLLVLTPALPVLGQGIPSGEAPPPPGVVGLNPDEAVERARGLHQTGRTAEALDLLKSTLGAAPGHVEASLLAADILVASNDYDLARNYYMQVLDKEPSNFKANLGIGKIWLANRYWRQAVSFLEKAKDVAPQESQSEAKRLLAGAYAQVGQFQKAIDWSLKAVEDAPEDLDSLLILVQIRQALLARDPKQIELALTDAEKYLGKAAQAVARAPLDRKALARLDGAYEILVAPPPDVGILQTYQQSFYQKEPGGRAIDKLLPGKGADSAAVLMRIADIYRQRALVRLVNAEQDAIVLIETAVKDEYDAKNVKYWEQLALTYQQLQDLTAKLVGPEAYADRTLPERGISACRKILELDPDNEAARQYLQAVGAPLTSQPAGDTP